MLCGPLQLFDVFIHLSLDFACNSGKLRPKTIGREGGKGGVGRRIEGSSGGSYFLLWTIWNV